MQLLLLSGSGGRCFCCSSPLPFSLLSLLLLLLLQSSLLLLLHEKLLLAWSRVVSIVMLNVTHEVADLALVQLEQRVNLGFTESTHALLEANTKVATILEI